jgi:hypothetical protein
VSGSAFVTLAAAAVQSVTFKRSLTRWEAFIGLSLHSMNEVWKQSSVIDKKARKMIPNQILVATLAVDFGRKTVRVSANFASSHAGYYNRESDEYITRCLILQPTGRSDIAPITTGFESAIRTMP